MPEQNYQDPVFNNEPVVQTEEPSQDNTQENLLSTENETRDLLFNLNTVTREELLLIPDMDEKQLTVLFPADKHKIFQQYV